MEEKSGLYIVAIVGIVAVVAMIILVMNNSKEDELRKTTILEGDANSELTYEPISAEDINAGIVDSAGQVARMVDCTCRAPNCDPGCCVSFNTPLGERCMSWYQAMK